MKQHSVWINAHSCTNIDCLSKFVQEFQRLGEMVNLESRLVVIHPKTPFVLVTERDASSRDEIPKPGCHLNPESKPNILYYYIIHPVIIILPRL